MGITTDYVYIYKKNQKTHGGLKCLSDKRTHKTE